MKWIKLGRIFVPNANYSWMHSHAANPFAENKDGDIFRIYFTCRDIKQRSHIAYVDVNIFTLRVLELSDKPLLEPGLIGTFDDSGVALSWIITINGEKLFYYLGWNLAVTVPLRNSIGLAKLNNQSNLLERNSLAPLMDRHHIDPYTLSYPCVLKEQEYYSMWYGSNLVWGDRYGDMRHVIKYARSVDGYNWQRTGVVAINLEAGQCALSKPCVIKDRDIYKMWYSFRGDTYRIGYAESNDGISWERKDSEVGIGVSSSGWDSEMICYAHVFDHKDRRFMVYCGDSYGKTGFGLARLE